MPLGFQYSLSSLTPVWVWCYHTPYHARHDTSNIKSPREEQKGCKHEFVAFHFKKVKTLVPLSCLTLCNPMECSPPWNSPGKNIGVGCIFFSRGIFLIQGLNLGFLHYRWILYSLSHQGRPCDVSVTHRTHSVVSDSLRPTDHIVHGILQARILEWVAFPFSRGSSNPGIEPKSFTLQADGLPSQPPGKPCL